MGSELRMLFYMEGNGDVFDGPCWRYDYVYDAGSFRDTEGMCAEMSRNTILNQSIIWINLT